MPTLVNDDGWASLSGRDKCLKIVRSIRRLVQEAPEEAFAFFGLVCEVFEKVRPRTAAADEAAEVSMPRLGGGPTAGNGWADSIDQEAAKLAVPGEGNGHPKTPSDGSDQGRNMSERDIADKLRGQQSPPERHGKKGQSAERAPPVLLSEGEAAGAADNTPRAAPPPPVVHAAAKPVPSIEEFTADLERYVEIWHAPKSALARLVGVIENHARADLNRATPSPTQPVVPLERKLFKEQLGTKRKADHSLPLGADLPGPKRPKASHPSSHLSAATGAKAKAEMAVKEKVAQAKAARDQAKAAREQAAADLKKAAAAAKEARADAARAAKEEHRREEAAKKKANADKAAVAKEAKAKEAKAKEAKAKEAKAKEAKAKEAKAKEAKATAAQAKAANAMANASQARTGQDAGRSPGPVPPRPAKRKALQSFPAGSRPPAPKLAKPSPARPRRTATDGGKKAVEEAAKEKEMAAQAARDEEKVKEKGDQVAPQQAAKAKAAAGKAAAAAEKKATDKAANAQAANDQAASTQASPGRHDHDHRAPPAAPSNPINMESSPAVSIKREIKLKES
ncbi:MAG: hypothetical protein M1826_007669 [Phylliscum demangeonii]|nr:MAG: hypothetical protein M1826_007669 [Phylliscum demangeonii]